jgi:hypothetical protein
MSNGTASARRLNLSPVGVPVGQAGKSQCTRRERGGALLPAWFEVQWVGLEFEGKGGESGKEGEGTGTNLKGI